jgi:hypothetical protein
LPTICQIVHLFSCSWKLRMSSKRKEYHVDPLKLGCLNGHALCTYFVGKYGRSFKHSTLKCFRRWKNPKLVQGLLRLQISRAPPWYFLPTNQSCLSPRLRPPPLLILQKLSLHYPSNGCPPLNVACPAVLVPSWHPPLLATSSAISRWGGCQEGTNTTRKATLRGGRPLDG